MTSTGGPGYGYGQSQQDQDATVLIPVVPVDSPGTADLTMVIPVTPGVLDEPTQQIQVPPDAFARYPQAGHPQNPAPQGGPGPYPYPQAASPGAADLTTTIMTPPTGANRGFADLVDIGTGSGANLAAESTAPPAATEHSVVRNSAMMAVFSLVSRITGLIRTVAIGAAIGASLIGNSYNLANTLPNMVYELLLGGVLGSVLIPFLTRARLRDPDKGQAYAQRLLSLATIFLAGATILAVAAAPLLTRLFSLWAHPRPDAPSIHLVTVLGYLILPEIFFYGLAALLAAILNTRGHFAAPTWTPILNNVVVIATAVLFIALPSVPASKLAPENISSAQILVLGVGTTLGIVAQALGLVPALRRVGFRWKWRFDWRELRLREIGQQGSWMLVYVVVTQITLIVLLIITNNVSQKKLPDGSLAPGIAIYNSAFLLFMMVHGIAAVSIMTALMPRLSAAAAEGRFADLAAQFGMGTRLSSVILLPATAAYIVLGHPIAISIFSWRSYTHQEAYQTGTIVAVAAIGLLPWALSQMQLFTFYSMPDTRTPALLAIPTAVLRIGLDILFYVVLPYAFVTAGLMVANTVSYVFAAVVGYALLRRKIGRLGLRSTWIAIGRLAVAAAVAAVPAWLVAVLLEHTMGTGKLASIATVIVGGAVLIVVYVAAAVALKARDLTDVLTMVRGRLGR